jgi:hypothetical protein
MGFILNQILLHLMRVAIGLAGVGYPLPPVSRSYSHFAVASKPKTYVKYGAISLAFCQAHDKHDPYCRG